MGTPGAGPADTSTVVIGIDGSGTSRAAFSWACGEARRTGGRAVAVFISRAAGAATAAVCTGAGFFAVGYPVPDPGTRQPVEEQAIEVLAEMLHEAAGLSLAVIHAPGDPVAELLRIAREVHADLIVVGGSAAIPHRRADSLGRRLAARARDPVVVIVPTHLTA